MFHLIKGLGRGGAEVLLSEVLRVANRDRYYYGYGYFLPKKTAMLESITAQGAEVFCFGAEGPSGILVSIRKVERLLRRWRADLLHCHLPLAAVVGRVAGRLASVPVVYTEHNQMEKHHRLTRWLNLATWKWQAQAIAVSQGVAASIQRYAGSGVPVQVVLNGVDMGRFRPGLCSGEPIRAHFRVPAGAAVVGTVAVFTAQKCLHDWLATAKLVLERHPGTHFLVVGDGPLRDSLVRLTDRLGLRDAVHFAGLQEDVRPYLAAMDLYLLSSQFEGFGVALIEAMAMQVPVVSTWVGGVPEVVRDGESGRLVPFGSVAALAEAVSSVLSDPSSMGAFGRCGRSMVERRFSTARMSQELESVYESVLQRYQKSAV